MPAGRGRSPQDGLACGRRRIADNLVATPHTAHMPSIHMRSRGSTSGSRGIHSPRVSHFVDARAATIAVVGPTKGPSRAVAAVNTGDGTFAVSMLALGL